ncbi:hypothetical protein M662_18810 [Bacillus sp. SB49]|uniref:hypothetical protein n=1 Tax=Bacillus sp. SB49 TaxID=1071080 RepID=UPI00040DC786|nr:hypothetical protein [Bacillus sp. SB49]QHT48450.1 hypothetical protein M662_18810 [Bacillus sp. SB49]
MLYVVFTQVEHSKIAKFEKIPFPEAVRLSQEIEKEMREKKEEVDGEFYLLEEDNNGDAIYSGTFRFGSYYAPNLYMHIKKKLPVIRTSKEKEKKRLALMAEMEELVSEEFKQEENVEEEAFRRLDRSRISRLKKWQRRTIYGLAAFFTLATVGTVAFFLLQIASFQAQYEEVAADKKAEEEAISRYEAALLGEDTSLKEYLAKQDLDELDGEEQKIYAGYLVEEEAFDKLVSLYEEDAKMAATFIANNQGIDALKAFNEAYPTNEAKFEIAYAEEEYDKVLSIENIETTKDRSEKKTYAYLKTGDIEKAKAELENNNSEELSEKIARYEEIDQSLADIDGDLKGAKEKEEKSLKAEKKELEAEKESL